MSKPFVALPVPHSNQPDYNRRTLPQYVEALERAGLEALIIAPENSPADVARLVSTCQGILLPGSPADVDPQKYGSDREPACAPADRTRDNIDELLLQDAHNMHKPIFAICYGLQALNVWRTGSLVQDLAAEPVKHEATGIEAAHPVEIDSSSIIGKAAATDPAGKLGGGKWTLPVNSSHHQAIGTVGDGLRVVATSPIDGVIEGIEGVAPEHWVVAVQWHPERSRAMFADSLFAAFADAVQNWTPRAVATSRG